MLSQFLVPGLPDLRSLPGCFGNVIADTMSLAMALLVVSATAYCMWKESRDARERRRYYRERERLRRDYWGWD